MLPHDSTRLPCVLWTGTITGPGYGQGLLLNGKRVGAHCAAWMQASGRRIPAGGVIAHTCDARPCIQNAGFSFYPVGDMLLPCYGHLFLATRLGNSTDMVSKKRQAVGRHHGNAKLTEDLVREIRQRRAAEGLTLRVLAATYGMSQGQLSEIIQRKQWAHVTP